MKDHRTINDVKRDYEDLLDGYCTIAKERTAYEDAFRRAESRLSLAEKALDEIHTVRAGARVGVTDSLYADEQIDCILTAWKEAGR
jgi:hypothetical protein